MSNGDDWMEGLDRPRVLVGVDGSRDGLRAVRFGARQALAIDGVLHLVHAVDDAVLAGAWGVVYDTSTLTEAGELATREALAVARELGLPKDRVHAEVQLGNGAAILNRLSHDAAMLVVGRRSMRGLERMFVGSTSVAVASGAHCPVLVISDATNPDQTGGHGEVAVAVGPESHSSHTLEWAVAEAERRGARLRVVHVAKDQAVVGGDQLRDAARRGIDSLLDPVLGRHKGVESQVEITVGSPVDVLLNLSREVDLLVLGVPRSVLGIHLGGVMRAVLAHAQSPVVLVK